MCTKDGEIAIFRMTDDEVFAPRAKCHIREAPCLRGRPRQAGSLPLHDWKNHLDSGAVAPDEGCVASYPINLENGNVYLSLRTMEVCADI